MYEVKVIAVVETNCNINSPQTGVNSIEGINPCCAEFILGIIKIFLHFL